MKKIIVAAIAAALAGPALAITWDDAPKKAPSVHAAPRTAFSWDDAPQRFFSWDD